MKLTFTVARQGFVTRHVPSLLQQPYWKSPALWCVGVGAVCRMQVASTPDTLTDVQELCGGNRTPSLPTLAVL